MLELRYQDGTILVFIRDKSQTKLEIDKKLSVTQNINPSSPSALNMQKIEKIKELFLRHFQSHFRFDQRVNGWRAEAYVYPQIVYFAIQNKIPYIDAKNWEKENDIIHRSIRTPRDYQQQAVDSWWKNRGRGIVVLPTGSGKTFVAELCIAKIARPTLIVAPTLDLVGQWYDLLKVGFQEEIGIIGGGHHEVKRITVSTYDSAHIHLPRYGDKFAFVVFDEIHHLPAPAYLQASKSAMAPFRLGLTATLDREDGREVLLTSSVGSVVYRRKITELSGKYLSDYEVIRILVDLSDEEKEAYNTAREEYLNFLSEKKINLGYQGWEKFIQLASRSKQGRSAFLAYRRAKEISHGSKSKMKILEDILRKERGKRIIIFSNDNQTAYQVSSRYLVPCITHQTLVKERRRLIGAFAEGSLPILATSRVLNEGVDIPSAEVAIVLSGTGTVREHVQRLGRILRPSQGKQAVMYELVSNATSEKYTSERRRRHDAYR